MQDLSNETVIHTNKDGVQFLQFRKLLEFSDVLTHAYSLGTDVDFSIKNPQSAHDYNKFCTAIGGNFKNVVKPNQHHTSKVQTINSDIATPDFGNHFKETDGLITGKKGVILSTTNADCILLLFFDPVRKVIANTHSGWRGTMQKIAIKTVEKMVSDYGCNPKDIICCMCPSIRKCHFEVERDVKDLFVNEFSELSGFICETVPNKKWHIDTILINRLMLLDYGLKAENIIDSGICSVCNSSLIHSYRVEGKAFGLETALIELKEF